jgi:outer membrane protein OmpA-like peptidoglycan-associated protein
MNTRTNKLRAGVLGIALVSTCIVTLPTYAQDASAQDVKAKQKASRQEDFGVLSGLAIGAVAGGPIGAVVGAAAGALLGDRFHKQATTSKALATDLGKSEAERTLLAKNVDQLHGSLADAQARGEKLDQALKNTADLQTDVSFRTNEDSINAQAVPPLLKLGALVASMPDMKVRVAGYADPRGSEQLNDALSRRRAEAVAAVLASAGVTPDRMIVEGHGNSESTSVDGDVDGYAFDRKVTVRLERPGSQEVASRE